MLKEIGSEFWISDVSHNYVGDSYDWISVWGNNLLTSSGRGAISLMLKHIEKKVFSKTVLLPAYCCESMITPFINAGYTCSFYDVDSDFKVNRMEMHKLTNKEFGVFLHMGYYGFPTNEDLYEYMSILNINGTIIIEDITHTLYSKYRRYPNNDYYIASLRKWVGLPTGGFLASKVDNINYSLSTQEDFSKIREEALRIKGLYIESQNKELKQVYLTMFKQSENILEGNSDPYSIDKLSNSIIQNLDTANLIKRRKMNFSFLLKGLEGIEGIEPAFNNISNDVCPIFFPVYIDKRREDIRKALADESIYCPVHWPIPSKIDISNYPLSKKIYGNILSIPCDQRYCIEDMARVVDTVNNYFKHQCKECGLKM